MAGGLVGLFDDVAALAKLAAASIDDVGAAAGRASMKAAGVVVDDAAAWAFPLFPAFLGLLLLLFLLLPGALEAGVDELTAVE